MSFIAIGNDTYIPQEKIKYIWPFNNKSKTVASLIKMLNGVTSKSTSRKTNSVIVLEDNRMFKSHFSPNIIYERAKACGHNFLLVNTDFYISVSHIYAISGNLKSLAIDSKDAIEVAGHSLQFIRQRSKKNTFLQMTSKETVGLSECTNDIVEQINTLLTPKQNG